MTKVGIISEYCSDSVNYGNTLQAYALNRYLQNAYPSFLVESIAGSSGMQGWRRCSIMGIPVCAGIAFSKLFSKIERGRERVLNDLSTEVAKVVRSRREAFERFARENISVASSMVSWKDLSETDYDALIVGSDVVWEQTRGFVRRAKFLDFDAVKDFCRISYAASFGNDWIPLENKRLLKNMIGRFDAVSVRESSSVGLLDSIGVFGARHVIDPTLLLDEQEWAEVEREPGQPSVQLSEEGGFVFAYMLGSDTGQREVISDWCSRHNLTLVTVPYSCGIWNPCDATFGDVRIPNLSPAEWIWLVRHADFVFTDSFHGIALSSNFGTRFVVLDRGKLGNRISDWLGSINHRDKLVPASHFTCIDRLDWKESETQEIISQLRNASKSFLEEALSPLCSTDCGRMGGNDTKE